jgi:hypothetical protein
MQALSRRRGEVFAILLGIAIGCIVTVVVLATATRPPGYQWPPASQVEGSSVNFQTRGTGIVGTGELPPDCTLMLADLDSTIPVVLWVTPHTEGVVSNGSLTISSYYYWSGDTPVTHVSAVVTITDPAAGANLVVFNPSANQSGVAYFGFAFSAGDCP